MEAIWFRKDEKIQQDGEWIGKRNLKVNQTKTFLTFGKFSPGWQRQPLSLRVMVGSVQAAGALQLLLGMKLMALGHRCDGKRCGCPVAPAPPCATQHSPTWAGLTELGSAWELNH